MANNSCRRVRIRLRRFEDFLGRKNIHIIELPKIAIIGRHRLLVTHTPGSGMAIGKVDFGSRKPVQGVQGHVPFLIINAIVEDQASQLGSHVCPRKLEKGGQNPCNFGQRHRGERQPQPPLLRRRKQQSRFG